MSQIGSFFLPIYIYIHIYIYDSCLKFLVPETAIFARKKITFADPIAELSQAVFRTFITKVIHEVRFRSPSSKAATFQYESSKVNFRSLESQSCLIQK